ncbi:MAG: hypothetical protein HYR62_02725 [Actinobacteria bacterium]|nr:hypothetical protein [Actinomycetota bacterium]MBI3687386.1 hypothetical protein [Actinomycetota bacterium]
MRATLRGLAGPPYTHDPWPGPLIHAWRDVAAGGSPTTAATRLWPHYLDRVHTYLASNHRQRLAMLNEAHATFTATVAATPQPVR